MYWNDIVTTDSSLHLTLYADYNLILITDDLAASLEEKYDFMRELTDWFCANNSYLIYEKTHEINFHIELVINMKNNANHI